MAHSPPSFSGSGWFRGMMLCFLLLTFPLDIHAADAPVDVAQISTGFDGVFRVGAWTQGALEVSVPQAGKYHLTIEAPDADDSLVQYTGTPVELTIGTKQWLTCLFKTGRLEGDLLYRLNSAHGVVWEKRLKPDPATPGTIQPLTYAKKLWVSLGKPAGLGTVIVEEDTQSESNWTFRPLEQTTTLPENWLGYQGVDAVILVANAKSKDGKLIPQTLSPAQHQALEQWVSNGGHLLVGLGKDFKLFADSPLGKWFPAKLEGEYQLRTFAPLQSFAGKPVRFDQAVTSALITLEPRRTLIAGVNGALAGELPYNMGRVSFVTLDLDHSLFEKWAGINRFYEQILIRGVDRSQGTTTVRKSGGRLSHSGIHDLSSQWYQAVSHFEQVRRPSIWGNLALIMLYLLIVGPLDYFVVHRILKRPELTWGTLPLWIVIGAACGLALARSSNGVTARANQVSVVDIDQGTGALHGRSWWSLYSPETRRYTVTPAAQTVAPAMDAASKQSTPAATGWWAPAENIVGGLYRRSGLQFGRRAYNISPQEAAVEHVPLQVWSTKSFSTDWMTTVKPFVKSKLTAAGTGFGILQGTVTWELGDELQDCMLVYGNRVFFPTIGKRGAQSIPSGIEWEPGISSQSNQRDLRGYLTKIQIRAVSTGASTGSKPVEELQTFTALYDVNARNIPEILTIMSFHEYAGGTEYTGLRNDVLGQMDWSPHLRGGRAVLFGRVKKSALKLAIDPHPSNAASAEEFTWLRSLLPVDRPQNVDLRNFDSPKKQFEEAPRIKIQ